MKTSHAIIHSTVEKKEENTHTTNLKLSKNKTKEKNTDESEFIYMYIYSQWSRVLDDVSEPIDAATCVRKMALCAES